MSNDFFDAADYTAMVRLTNARAEAVNAVFSAVEAGFDKLPTEANIKQGKVNYAVDTGAANAYVVSLPHAPAAYGDGLEVNVKIGAGNTNTSTSCTINVNSLGAVAIKDYAGNDPAVGDLAAGAVIQLRHNGTNFRMVGATIGAAAAAAASATAAATSATNAAASASGAASSASAASTSATDAAASATAAAASAAALNLPNPTVALNFLRVNAGATAYELQTPSQVLSNIGAQSSHANLTAFAGLTLVADRLPYANGAGTLALATFTAAGRTLVGAADASAQRTILGLGTADSPQFTGVELGHATDTTLTRSAAGRLAVEGKNAILLGQTDAITSGYSATPYNAGTQSSGTFTPDEADGNFQYAINGGAHTLASPTNNCTIIIQYTNNASAGSVTVSGFTKVTGGTITTTNGDDFLFFITKLNGFSHLHVQVLQ